MKKHIAAGVIAFVFAALAGAECSFIFALPFIMGEQAAPVYYFYLVLGALSISLAISGGIYAIRHSSKSFVLCWTAVQAIFPIAVVVAFSGVLNVGNFLALLIGVVVFLPDVLGCVALIFTVKPKHTLAYVSELINWCGALALITYSIFRFGNGYGSGFGIGFGLLGFLGCGFTVAAIIRAHSGRAFSFELTILSLLCFAAQFIVILTACGVYINAYMVMLGMLSVVMIIIGGVLIADTLESGFIILSFGIILLLALLALVTFYIGIGFVLATVIAIAGLVVHFAETVKMRSSENAKLTKSI